MLLVEEAISKYVGIARIDYAKLTRMAQWMYLTGWFVATAPQRPALDPGFRLER